jgi:alkylation response protein AidB-like acyl-CoA dehydrogenase
MIPRQEGVTTKHIKTTYSPTVGTAFVTFDNVRVPVENTLGPEGGGIFVILSNFNHERTLGDDLRICSLSGLSSRNASNGSRSARHLASCSPRRLSSVRAKVAAMIARAEAFQARLENVTYQMCNMVRKIRYWPSEYNRLDGAYDNCFMSQSYKEQATKLAGQIAFLKCTVHGAQRIRQGTRCGGRSITPTGMGRFIEHASCLS